MKQGRVVLITGAAGGMGSLFVDRFLANGDTVIATDDSETALNELQKKEHLHTTMADISDDASCAQLAEFARDKAGRVDVLINRAGNAPVKSFDDMSLADWNKVIGTDLTGDFIMVKAILPLIKGRGWGRVISIGSGSVFDGLSQRAHYVAAQAGVIGLHTALLGLSETTASR